jgi:hypothetical protein
MSSLLSLARASAEEITRRQQAEAAAQDIRNAKRADARRATERTAQRVLDEFTTLPGFVRRDHCLFKGSGHIASYVIQDLNDSQDTDNYRIVYYVYGYGSSRNTPDVTTFAEWMGIHLLDLVNTPQS